MLFKSRLFRLVITLSYILIFIIWLTNLKTNWVITIIFLFFPLMDIYTEFALVKRNTKVFLLNSKHYDLLVYFVILTGIILLTHTIDKGQITFVLFLAVAALYNKTRKDLLFLEEGGYLMKSTFGFKKVYYSDISEVARENNILSFTYSNNLFQIDLCRMKQHERKNLLKELKTHIQVKELA